MNYKEFQPDRQLADFVKCNWWFDNSTNQELNFIILPDGCFDLIVSLDKHKQIEISLTGLWTKQIEISIPPRTQLFGVRFKLLSAEYILQQSISSFCDREQKMPNNFLQLDKISFERPETITSKFDTRLLSILESRKGIDERKRILFNLQYLWWADCC